MSESKTSAVVDELHRIASAIASHDRVPPACRAVIPALMNAADGPLALGAACHQIALNEAAARAAAQAAAAEAALADLVYVGAAERPAAWSSIGWRRSDDRGVALARTGGEVILGAGTIGAGKSQGLLTVLDAGLCARPGLSSATLPPTAAVALHTDLSGTTLPELCWSIAPNQHPSALKVLLQSGLTPRGLPRVRLLCPPEDLHERAAALGQALAGLPCEHPLEIRPLRLRFGQLGARGLEALLGVPPNRVPLYLLTLMDAVRQLGPDLTLHELRRVLARTKGIDRTARERIEHRLAVIARLEDPGADLWESIEPGVLTIVDLSSRWLRRQDVFPLAAALLNVLCQRSPRHGALQRLIALDEINRLARDPALWEHLVMVARQARHLGLTLWLSGQDLLTVPDEMLGVATQVLCFRMANPQVYYDVQSRVAGLRGASSEQVHAAALQFACARPRQEKADSPGLDQSMDLVQQDGKPLYLVDDDDLVVRLELLPQPFRIAAQREEDLVVQEVVDPRFGQRSTDEVRLAGEAGPQEEVGLLLHPRRDVGDPGKGGRSRCRHSRRLS